MLRAEIETAISELRRRQPLVQCLTNIVVANFTANVLLSAGAAPAMVDNRAEAAQFAGAAGAVLVNTGTPYEETADAMVAAVTGAAQCGTPWVLDPVAASLPWRRDVARRAIAAHRPTIIRGNASEIIAIYGDQAAGRGVDSADSTSTALAPAMALARNVGCTVAISGAVDLVTDGTRSVSVSNGHEWLTRVTGTGCALGALMAGLAAVSEPLVAAVAATALLCVAGEDAAAESRGPGSFATALVDRLYLLDPADVAARAQVHDVAA